MAEDLNEQGENENHLEYSAIFLCLILVWYVLTSHVIEKKKIYFLHESAMSILFGLLSALFLDKAVGVQVEFNEKLFFSVILPPIIFSAGYTMRKKYFIQNFTLIQFYGIIGTIIAFFVISSFTIMLNEWNALDVKLGITELLLLSAVLCATDTVAVLNLVKETEFPILNSILFGEGIMNDAISIVIFRAVGNFATTNQEFESKYIFTIMWNFVSLLVMSVLIGLVSGLIISYFFKKFDSYNQYPIKETSLILLVSYITYLLSELFGLSGIISLFVCGITMGQYTYKNISQASQKGTVLVFETISYLAEAFVFCYLGISVYSMKGEQIPYLFSFLVIPIILLARFFAIFTLPCMKFLCRRSQTLSMKELKIIWYSGLIRGAIAFAMVLQIKSENSKYLVNTVMVVVVVSIVFLSSLLQVFSRYVGLQGSEEEEMIKKMVITENQASDISEFGMIGRYSSPDTQESQDLNEKKMGVIRQKLTTFEEKYMRPVFQKDDSQQIQEINMAEFSNNKNNSEQQ